MKADHPAKFSDNILQAIDSLLPDGKILDPFAGTGRIHELATPTRKTVGVEIEFEWADMHPDTIHGDSFRLSEMFAMHEFDAIATSPTYGNRMADHHQANDGSRRLTYRHTLGRALAPTNTGRMQWGDNYREIHTKIYGECVTVTKPGGYFLLNVKDHIRKGERVPVTEWHVETLESLGFRKEVEIIVPVEGMKFGQNRELRVPHESVVRFQKEG